MASRRKYADRVKDSTTTTGTGNATLSGTAPTGFVDFNTAMGNGSSTTATRFFYTIAHQTLAEWENGIGYLSASTTLVRETVLASTNSNALVSFSSGTKDVFNSFPADHANKVSKRGLSLVFAAGNFMG